MKCKDCGKKIKNWFRVLIRYRVRLTHCIWCSTARLVEYREAVIFRGTNLGIGKSCLDVSHDNYCPLYSGFKCHTESFEFCPYKDGWRSCYYYIKHEGKKNKLDKGLTDLCDLAGLSYAIYKDMVKDDE